MQIKTAVRRTSYPLAGLYFVFKGQSQGLWEDVEKLELSDMTGGDGERLQPLWKRVQ